MTKRRSERGDFIIEELGEYEMPKKMDSQIRKMTAAADLELEAARVNFRWQTEPLKLIKLVAALMGVPYQTYIKQVLYRQALKDLEQIQTYGGKVDGYKLSEPRVEKNSNKKRLKVSEITKD